MKKLITIILALSMLIPAVSLADLPDVTVLSDQELKDLITAASAELIARNADGSAGTLVFECEGVKLYQIGEPRLSSDYMYIPVAVYNDLDYELTFMPNAAKINGWEVYSSGVTVVAKAKKKGEISFKISDADVKETSQIESLRMSWQIFNQETWDIMKVSEEEEYRFW